MAKSKKTIRRYRRSRWSANIQEINNVTVTTASGSWSGTSTLATNPSQDILGVSQVYTVKNFDISFTIECEAANNLEAISVYIMFVPQGMNVSSNYNLEHPEYIMNYKYLGSPTYAVNNEDQQFQPVKVRTRMARKLNTGDSIILFIKGINETNHNQYNDLKLSGLVRWWTKAN